MAAGRKCVACRGGIERWANKWLAQEKKQQELDSNAADLRVLKQLEKQLKLKPNKALPASFHRDGLDYLLEPLLEPNAEPLTSVWNKDDSESDDNSDGSRNEAAAVSDRSEEEPDSASDDEEQDKNVNNKLGLAKKSKHDSDSSSESCSESNSQASSDSEMNVDSNEHNSSEEEHSDNESYAGSESDDADDCQPLKNSTSIVKKKDKKLKDRVVPEQVKKYHEDIYGRTVDESGRVVTGAYVPPGKRLQAANASGVRSQSKTAVTGDLLRTCKQVKGLINRLTESNLEPISLQIAAMYESHSRAEINEILSEALLDSCISIESLTPDRLLQEHAALIEVLHATVGHEVSATLLQALVVSRIADYLDMDSKGKEAGQTMQDGKMIDNALVLFAHLYNFKVIECGLMFDLLDKLSQRFSEKDIELLLLILQVSGFSLRADDPLRLKQLMSAAQAKCATAIEQQLFTDQSRIKYMLDVLIAIKNNNKNKIAVGARFDAEHLDHLKKLVRACTKEGNTAALNVSLTDLLTKDKWWLTCSATAATLDRRQDKSSDNNTDLNRGVSTALVELARKQRMNTDVRRNIFYVIMQSEDYVDAFNKLQKLGLKHTQERELIHVLLDLCEQEKTYNAFYAHLAQKYCLYDRRFQMAVQFAVWDRLKVLSDFSERKIKHLAAILSYLISTQALSLSIFKVLEFAELDKPKVSLLRLVLRSLLTESTEQSLTASFKRISALPRLKPLRTGLKLFMHHFILRTSASSQLGDEIAACEILRDRVEVAEMAMSRT